MPYNVGRFGTFMLGRSLHQKRWGIDILGPIYNIDHRSPCPLVTLNPFGRELLLLDVFTGFKRSTWIQRTI
jgi:hypothetical protein